MPRDTTAIVLALLVGVWLLGALAVGGISRRTAAIGIGVSSAVGLIALVTFFL